MSTHSPNVILVGGPPPELSQEHRVVFVEDVQTKVKIQNGNRYEHFEPTGEKVVNDKRELLVYAWSACTYIAE